MSAGFSFLEDSDHRLFPPLRQQRDFSFRIQMLRSPAKIALCLRAAAYQNALRKRGRALKRQRAKDLRGLRCVRATMDATNVGYRTAARPNAKFVSNETGLKKFFLNMFGSDRAAWRALLSASGCGNIFRSDRPHCKPPKFVSRNVQNE